MKYTQEHFTKITQLLLKPEHLNGHSTHCHCPYHRDKTPSLSVSIVNGAWQCFSCKRKGNLVQMIPEKFGKSIALFLRLEKEDEFLAVLRPREDFSFVEESIDRDVKIDIRGIHKPWREYQEVKDYLQYRGISPSISDEVQISYMPEGFINGTFIQKRILIPIYRGKELSTIECRDITGKVEGKKKCIYPYQTIKPLWNFDNLDLNQPVFLFEGLLKLLVARLDRYFFNSTTPFGSNFSTYQMGFLNQIPHLIVIPDRDEAGQKMIKYLKKHYKGNLSILNIRNDLIKDCDEIVTILHTTVKDFRLQNGFYLESGLLVRS